MKPVEKPPISKNANPAAFRRLCVETSPVYTVDGAITASRL